MLGLPALLDTGLKIIDKFIPDPEQKAKARTELLLMNQKELEEVVKSDIAQSAVNKAEAESSSFFKSGWRPAAGWTCVIGLFYTAIGKSFLTFTLTLLSITFEFPVEEIPELPSVASADLMTLLFGMLGLGAYRSYDKKQRIK